MNRAASAGFSLILSLSIAECQQQRAPGAFLTPATLRTFLEQLGYAPESGPRSGLPYIIMTKMGGVSYPVSITLSPEGTDVVVFTVLTKGGDAPPIPAIVVMKLLKENYTSGPVYFALSPEEKRLSLWLPLTNGGITPTLFKRQFESFVETLNRTSSLWEPATWTASAPASEATARKPAAPGATTELAKPAEGGDFVSAVISGQTGLVRKFLAAGSDPNLSDRNRITVLMLAAAKGHTAVAEALLERGANVNAQNVGGATASIYAMPEGRFEIIKSVLRRGADVDLVNSKGESAIVYVPVSDANRVAILDLLATAPVVKPIPLASLAKQILVGMGEFKKAFTHAMVLRIPDVRLGSIVTEPVTQETVDRAKQDLEQTKKEMRLVTQQSAVLDAEIKADTQAAQFASNPLPERVAGVKAALEKLTTLCSSLTASKDWKDLVEVRLGHPVLLNNARLRRYLRYLEQVSR